VSTTVIIVLGDKAQYEETDRSEEIQAAIQASGTRFKELADDIELGGQLLQAVNQEFRN
jgi:hypothetical protein